MNVDPRAFRGLSRFLAPSAGGPVADRALREKLITSEQLDLCIQEQDRSGRSLDEILVERGLLKPGQVESLRAPALPAEVLPWASNPERLLGHYVLVSSLGTGGMAEVWKAWDRSIGRWVAVKYLKKEIGHPTQRIEREGRMAGQLSHPSIISIYERGQHEGRPYLVMPLVDGSPPRPPLPPRSAAVLAADVARALSHVHEAGVIHRDVKPANILVASGGRALLSDFGLAILDESATSRWAVSGTPEYASPEQVRGDPLDFRTDLYSLGATLYHLLAGRPPYSGANVDEIVRKILDEDPPPLAGVPRGLAQIVRRAMSRNRGNRYASAQEMAAELDAWLEEARPAKRLRPVWLVSMGLALAISWGSTYAILRQSQRQEEREFVLQCLREGDRSLSAAERRRSDPAASRAYVAMAAREALAEYSLALGQSGGMDAEAELGLGRVYELLGDDRKALDAYEKAKDLSAARLALAWLAARCLLEGRPGKNWRAVITTLEAPPRALRLLAEGKWHDLRTSGGSVSDTDLGGLVLGAAAIEEREWDAALEELDRALRFRPNESTILYYRGLALAGKGDLPSAKVAWRDAQRNEPPDWPLHAELLRHLRLGVK